MTGDTVPASTGRHGITSAIAIALTLVLTHNGITPTEASGIAWSVATALGGVARWLIRAV